jgi:colicin import membrane protein
MGFNIEQYESVIVNNNGNWSNANGYDKADLNSKIRNAKDTIIDRTGKRNSAQAQYDDANGRNCSAKKSKDNHPLCWKKEADKADRANDITVYTAEIDTANFNIGAWEHELDIIAQEEADAIAQAEADAIAQQQALEIAQAEADVIAQQQALEIAKIKAESQAKIAEAKKKAEALAKAKADSKKTLDVVAEAKAKADSKKLVFVKTKTNSSVDATSTNKRIAKASGIAPDTKAKTKKYLIIGGVLVALIGAYFIFKKK